MVRVMGYDPSSTLGGLALAVDGEPEWIGVWRPQRSSDKALARLKNFAGFARMVIATMKPDIVIMEVIRVGTSHDTTRAMSRFESAFLIAAMEFDCQVIEFQVSQGRAAFYGSGLGSMPKVQSYAAMRARYPNLAWLPADKTRPGDGLGGGLDQADALLPALAWERIVERQAEVAVEKKAKNARKRARKA
jgi:Holliday junction resolvasome RuvABC endonuclease subunit